MTIAVVGGGAVGTTVAYDLACAGEDVVLYERGRIGDRSQAGPGQGSTPRAAGVCYDAYADRRDARIGTRSIERFREFSGRGEFAFTDRPYVWLAADDDQRRKRAIREDGRRMQEHGLDVSVLDAAALGDRYPSLRTDDVGVAAVTTGAGFTEPGSYPVLLADLAGDAGATIHEDTPVGIDTDPLRVVPGEAGAWPAETGDGSSGRTYEQIVLATGAATKMLCAMADIHVPLKPYRVQALTADLSYDGPMVYDATAGVYCRPHPTGLLAGDGTITTEADPQDWRRGGDPAFVRATRGRLHHRLGLAFGAVPVERAWSGLCVATPDRAPLVGQLQAGLFVAAGWQGHGFMRAPAIAERLAGIVRGERDPVPGFDPNRFDGDEAFDIVEGMELD